VFFDFIVWQSRRIVLHVLMTQITKEQLAAVIKAVEEGGDDDDEITEDEAIAILQDTGLDAEIPFVREWFAWERSRNRPQ
jgi:hypothetical protein